MAASYYLRFLGSVQVTWNNSPIQGLRSRKAVALLSYLATHGESISRTQLTTIFWPELPEARALGNLSWIITHLNSHIPGCLSADRYHIRFEPSEKVWVDLVAFRELMERNDPLAFSAAVELYRGEFMQGFYLNGCPDFETWLLYERERWQQRVMQVLETLIVHERDRGTYRQGLQYANQLVQLDTYSEVAHRYVMSMLALDGQRTAALAQYETCKRILAEELGLDPSEETSALYEEIRAGKTSVIKPPEAVLPETPRLGGLHNLPSPYTPFFGREQELAQLSKYLESPSYRLLTITGPGGIGKTRLALRLAEDHRGAFRHGVCMVPLSSVASSDTVVFAIAQALNLSFSSNSEPLTQLMNLLSTKELLLFLDNYEHLIEGSMLLLELLRVAPQIKLLVTSRERLNLQAEQLFVLQGLPIPPEDDQSAASASAVQLFTERAQRTNQAFELAPDNLDAVVRTCELVEGSPLGIELAATWATLLTPNEISEAIEKNIDVLATSMHDVPARHRSMRAVFEGSWSLLSQSEQQALAQVAIFQAGFSQDAVLTVTNAGLSDLVALGAKSLIKRAAFGRYKLHTLVQHYASEKLAQICAEQPSWQDSIYDRHSDYYLNFVQEWDLQLNGANPQLAISNLRDELDNIRQAWRWAVEHAKLAQLEACTLPLTRFYNLTCLFDEGETTFTSAAERIERMLHAGTGPEARLEILLGRLRAEQVCFMTEKANYERALEIAAPTMALARKHQVPDLAATVAFNWADVLFRQGKYDEAQQQLREGLALVANSSSSHMRQIEALCLYLLGKIMVHRSDYRSAKSYLEQALCIYGEIGSRIGEGITLDQLGGVFWYEGDYTTARSHHEHSLVIFQEIGNVQYIAGALHNLADASWPQGEYMQAKQTFEQTLGIYRELGDGWHISVTLLNLGRVLLLLGDYAQARLHLDQALQLSRELGILWVESLTLTKLSALLHEEAEFSLAYEHARQGLAIARALGSGNAQAHALTCLGHTLVQLGQFSEASELYHQALALRYQLGQQHRANEVLAGLARIALSLGRLEESREHVEVILKHLAEGRFEGSDEPMQIYLTCYKVLQASQDSRAHELLSQALSLLDEQSAKIGDSQLRRRFLEQIAAHHELRQLAADAKS